MFSRVIARNRLEKYCLWKNLLDQFSHNPYICIQKLTGVSLSTLDNTKIENTKPNTISEKEFLVKLKSDPDKFGITQEYNGDEGDVAEEEFLKDKILPSQKLSTKKYADIIKSLIKQRKIKEAIDVVEKKMLKEDQFKPENYIYNLLIGACGRVGYTKKGFSLYNDMKKRGLKVTGGTYTALFNACANSPWPKEGLLKAKHLRNIMIEKMYEPNDTNYNAMIKAFGRCGDLSTAFGIVDEMIEKNFRINNDTINFLLQACITDKQSGFRHALLVWRKMIKLKIQPSLFTFNLMLRSIRDCNLGDIEVTKDVLSQILPEKPLLLDTNSSKLTLGISNEKIALSGEENGIISNSHSVADLNPNLLATVPHLGNLISLSQVMKPEEKFLLVGGMTGFLDNMISNECTPDIKTFTQLLDVIPNTSAAENELLSRMKKLKVKFDIDFFNMVIKRRNVRFDYESARDVLKIASKYHLRANLVTYGVLALGCRTKDEALSLIEEMKECKYRLNAEILGTMLCQACHHKIFSYIIEIMELCIKENIQPNQKFIEHLDNFKATCRRMIKNKGDEFGQSKQFQTGFQMFRMHYKKWITRVQIDNNENIHPWQQFKEETDPKTDKYFKYKDANIKFKPRHTPKTPKFKPRQ